MLRSSAARVSNRQIRTTNEERSVSPTTTAPPASAPPRARRVGQKLLGSAFLDLLAGPPGVDGYLEQVRPTWAVRDCRAEVTSVQRQTPDSITLGLRPHPGRGGMRGGPVRRHLGRDRWRLAKPLLLPRLRGRDRPRPRDHH